MENLQAICSVIWQQSTRSIPSLYRNMYLNNIKGDEYKPILEKIENWDFKDPPVFAIISKQNGIGKSHLASGMLKLFIKKYVIDNYDSVNKQYLESNQLQNFYQRFSFSFIPERMILREIRDSYKSKYKTESDIFDEYCKPTVLVIDDIFSSKETGDKDFTRRTILDLINDRAEYYLRPTILTSNLSLNEIADIDTRLASRIRNENLIEITTKLKDWRE